MHMIIVKEHEGLLMIVLLNYNRTWSIYWSQPLGRLCSLWEACMRAWQYPAYG